MKRHSAFLVLAALGLSCWMAVPSTSYGWGRYGYGGWGGYGCGGYGGWGRYGYGGWGGYGGYGWGGYGGYGGWGGYGGYGWGGMPWYASNWMAPYYYTPYSIVTTAPVTRTVLLSSATTVQPARQPDRAYIQLQVPANARVQFNNTAMHEQGTTRTYVTPPLTAGNARYSFDVTVRWNQDGNERRENRVIFVTPGNTTDVNFLASGARTGTDVTPASTTSRPEVK